MEDQEMTVDTATHVHTQIICTNVFIRRNNRWLVLRRSPKKKYAPGIVHPVGGKLDRGENPFEGAKREVLEETGLSVKNMRLEAVLLDIEPVKGEPYDWLVYHFSADYDSGDLRGTPEGELIWLSAAELVRERLHPSVESIIHQILDRKTGVLFTTNQYDPNKVKIVKSRVVECVARPPKRGWHLRINWSLKGRWRLKPV
jgi:8-oxo-dGTP diphosphatase